MPSFCILKDHRLYTGCCLSSPTSILLSLLSLKERLISKLEPRIACSIFTHIVPAQCKSKRFILKKKKIQQCSTLKKAQLRSDFYSNNREISV